MCGIVGAVTGQRDVVPLLLAGLELLEYRGYDSAGMAVLDHGQLQTRRRTGRVRELADGIGSLAGTTGIAHTRWATHGEPSEANAHPHVSDHLAIVHNGIIENYQPLRAGLEAAGYRFQSDTDSEVIAHLLHQALQEGRKPEEAMLSVCCRLQGSYAIAMTSEAHPGMLVLARHGSPLLLGLGVGEHYCASDAAALVPLTQRMVHLEDGDVAILDASGYRILDRDGRVVERQEQRSSLQAQAVELGPYRHFMEKEIHEQPVAIAQTLAGLAQRDAGVDALLAGARQVMLICCGTSYHAALCGRYWFEELAGLPAWAEVASEFRYRTLALADETLFIFISQSGETADTLAAARYVKENLGRPTLAITNVPESSLARATDACLLTRAGPEIGVASTKAFVTQLVALLSLALDMGAGRGHGDVRRRLGLREAMDDLPATVDEILDLDEAIADVAAGLVHRQHALFLGRGLLWPIALEGALKLKEISYIHAEAYPAGELKHGPLALVDEDMPVVGIASHGSLLDKMFANLAEVQTRGGQLILFADRDVLLPDRLRAVVLRLPAVADVLAPIAYVVPLQLLAYHVAVHKGTDVDKPRNLAKSVTVE